MVLYAWMYEYVYNIYIYIIIIIYNYIDSRTRRVQNVSKKHERSSSNYNGLVTVLAGGELWTYQKVSFVSAHFSPRSLFQKSGEHGNDISGVENSFSWCDLTARCTTTAKPNRDRTGRAFKIALSVSESCVVVKTSRLRH